MIKKMGLVTLSLTLVLLFLLSACGGLRLPPKSQPHRKNLNLQSGSACNWGCA